jgi:hypothetical protein
VRAAEAIDDVVWLRIAAHHDAGSELAGERKNLVSDRLVEFAVTYTPGLRACSNPWGMPEFS